MTWNTVAAYVASAWKFVVAAGGVAVMAALHVWANNPNAGTRDLVIAAATAIAVWLVPNRPLSVSVSTPSTTASKPA